MADGDLALVGARLAPQQVVQDALAQGRVAVAHGLDAELVEHRLHGGQSAHDDRLPVGTQPGQVGQRVHMPGTQTELFQLFQPLAGDGRMAEVGIDQRQQRLGRAGGAHHILPAQPPEGMHVLGQPLAAVQPGLAQDGAGDLAAAEELLGERHAADLQRFTPFGLVVDADDALGGAAADVDDQPQLVIERQTVRRAQIDEAGLLTPGHHLDGVAQYRTGLLQKGADVVCHPEGVGGHGPEALQLQPLQPLGKAAQGLQRPLAGLVGQVEVFVQPGAQPDRLLDLVQNAQLGAGRRLVDLGQQQAEAVGPQIHGCQGPPRQ